MRYLFILLVFILLMSCQTKERANQNIATQPYSISVSQVRVDSAGCTFYNSGKKEGDIFPFNKSDQIELISFKYRVRYSKIRNNELIKDGKFVVPNIDDRVALNKAQSDSLFSILYNVGSPGDSLAGADCY